MDVNQDLQRLREALEKAIEDGNKARTYEVVGLITIYFEGDTHRMGDCRKLEAEMKAHVQLTFSAEIVVKHRADCRYVFRTQLMNIINQRFGIHHRSMQSLLIFHYAGHGKSASPTGGLLLHNGKETKLKYSIDFNDVKAWLTAPLNGIRDIIYILDCCYAATAARDGANGTIELLAASSGLTPLPSTNNTSFTESFIHELGKVSKEGTITIRNIFDQLVNTRKAVPFHIFLSGSESIILPKKPSKSQHTSPSVSTPASSSEYEINLSLSCGYKMGDAKMTKLLNYIRKLSQISVVSIEDVTVEDVSIKDVSIKDVPVEDVAAEDVAVEDVAVEDDADTEPVA